MNLGLSAGLSLRPDLIYVVTANQPSRSRFQTILLAIILVVGGVIAWKVIGIFVFWPAELKAIRLLEGTIQMAWSDIPGYVRGYRLLNSNRLHENMV